MSFDLTLLKVKPGSERDDNAPSEPMGSIAEVQEILRESFPQAEWRRSSLADCQTEDFRCEIALGTAEAMAMYDQLYEIMRRENRDATIEELERAVKFNPLESAAVLHVSLNIRGDGLPITKIVNLCRRHSWILVDSQEGTEIDLDNTVQIEAGFKAWRSIRDNIADSL